LSYLVICSVALVASALTFFSGFGLGTLLLPAFALFFAVEQAVALTAVVHFLNGLFKLFLVWPHIDRPTVLRFGAPAIVGGVAGAWTLLWLADAPPVLNYSLLGRSVEILPAKLIVGSLLLFFASAELLPSFRATAFPPRYQPVGGVLSGFFRGLAGMQGALRSAFLIKAGLTKESYVATGAAIAFLIDVSRISMYTPILAEQRTDSDYALLIAAVVAAFFGAAVGNRYLPKVTMGGIQAVVATLLFLVAFGLISGLL
jgi:uncharacterized membrane protein YfcA